MAPRDGLDQTSPGDSSHVMTSRAHTADSVFTSLYTQNSATILDVTL